MDSNLQEAKKLNNQSAQSNSSNPNTGTSNMGSDAGAQEAQKLNNQSYSSGSSGGSDSISTQEAKKLNQQSAQNKGQ